MRVMQTFVLATGLGFGCLFALPTAAQQAAPSAGSSAQGEAKSRPKSVAGKAAKASKAKAADEAGTETDKTAIDAEAALDKAAKALAGGKPQITVGLADQVLGSAGKTPRTTARALALRGQARLKLGKPAEAMADLDSALWVKDGLGAGDREAASAAKAESYRQAGVADQATRAANSVGQVEKAVAPGVAAPNGQARPAAAFAPSVTPGQTAAPMDARTETTRSRGARSEASALPPPAAPAKIAEGSATNSSGGAGSFFSNLFGLSSKSQDGTAVTGQPSTTGALPTAVKPAAVSSSEPQRAPGQEPPAPATKKLAPREPVAIKSADATGSRTAAAAQPVSAAVVKPVGAAEGFQLQLAAVRTPEAAKAMADKVRSEHAASMKGRTFTIDEPVFGNMGKFYRVRIGPFASASDSLAVCSAVRNQGLDCMVVGH